MEHIACIEDAGERRRIAREVLLALPEWFGIPESTEEYIAESGGQPFWAALGPDGRTAGRGCEYAQVKTVQRGRCAEYDATNAFYRRLGFRELEVVPTLWDKANPCQIYVKYIGGGA